MTQSIDDMIDEVAAITPSTQWPPVLAAGETTRYTGAFNRATWLRSNVGASLMFFSALIVIGYLLNSPISKQGFTFAMILLSLGAAITYAMYHRQEWIITNRAVYVNRGRPMLLSSARKIAGFGSTIRLTGRWGVGVTLLGVQNATEIRATLNGITP
jgi:hypothetical protein